MPKLSRFDQERKDRAIEHLYFLPREEQCGCIHFCVDAATGRQLGPKCKAKVPCDHEVGCICGGL